MYTKQYYYWWQTQDDRLGWDIGYLYSENLNPFASTGHIELSRKPTLSQTTNELCTDSIEVKFTDTINTKKIFISQATIFKEWQTAFWWQNLDPSYPTPEDRYIRHIWQMWNYVYWTYDTDTSSMAIWRFEAIELNNASLIAPTYQYSGFTWNLNGKHISGVHKMATVGNIVYLTMWEKISRIDYWAMTITNYDFWWDVIVGINYKSWGWFEVCLKWGKIFFWDGVSDWPWELQQLPDYVVATSQIWDDTYIIWWQYQWYWLSSPTLYRLWANGFEKLFTQTKSYVLNESKFRIVFNSNQSITKVRDFIVMIDQANTGNDRIAVFGSNVNWLQRAYVVLNTRNSQGSDMVEIGFVKWYGNKLYFWWSDWDTKGIDYIDFDPFADFTYESTWYVVTNVEDMWNKLIRKAQCQLFTRLSDVDTNNTVVLAMNKNISTFENIATVTELDYVGIDRQAIQWDFRDVCLKVTLNSAGTTSPKLYWQQLQYEEQPI